MSESLVYLVKLDGETVGTVSLQWEDERNWGPQPPIAGYMHRLAIKDGFHGQSIGKRVVDWAAFQVAENGREFLRLDCEASNTHLCGYYESLGFRQVGTRPVSEYGNYVAALYQKRVGEPPAGSRAVQ
jgi:ribosomal protein S18 acetylase RimI-like enzyme